MKILFLIASIILPIYSPILYVKAILGRKAKPHRTTRFVILTTTILTTASLFAQHDQVALWLSFISMLQAITIFSLSIKYGMGGWAKTDILCLILASVGIIMWRTTTNPVYGLYFGIVADIMGMIPTLIKTYRHPETEIWTFFAIDATAAVFNLFALSKWTIQSFSYPAYIWAINTLVALLALRANGHKEAV